MWEDATTWQGWEKSCAFHWTDFAGSKSSEVFRRLSATWGSVKSVDVSSLDMKRWASYIGSKYISSFEMSHTWGYGTKNVILKKVSCGVDSVQVAKCVSSRYGRCHPCILPTIRCYKGCNISVYCSLICTCVHQQASHHYSLSRLVSNWNTIWRHH